MSILTISHSDEDLLRRWRDGDVRAGAALIERHIAAVHAFLQKRSTQDANDLTQDTLLICLSNPESFRGDSSFRTFVLGIAYRRLLLAQRQRCKAGSVHQPQFLHAIRYGESTARELEVESGLRQLPDELRLVLELRYWAGFSEREIADTVGCPIGTVASRLRRAKVKMREFMDYSGWEAKQRFPAEDPTDPTCGPARATKP